MGQKKKTRSHMVDVLKTHSLRTVLMRSQDVVCVVRSETRAWLQMHNLSLPIMTRRMRTKHSASSLRSRGRMECRPSLQFYAKMGLSGT